MEENKTAEAAQVQDKPIIHLEPTHPVQEPIEKEFVPPSSNNFNHYNYTNSHTQNHGPSIPFSNQLKLAMDVNCNLDWLMSGITRIPRSHSLYASTTAISGYRGPMSTSKLPNYYHNVPVRTQHISSCEYNCMCSKAPMSGRSSSVKPQHLNQRKLEKLKQELQKVNNTLGECQKKPEQRTVKLQTKDNITRINRGVEACNIENEDKEISAQPTFRQESFDKAVSEKLDEIEQKAKLESSKKKKLLRLPTGKFLQVSHPVYKSLHANGRPQSIPHMYNKATIHRADARYGGIINQKQNEINRDRKRKLPYEREKRVESLSVNEIDSAMKTLMF